MSDSKKDDWKKLVELIFTKVGDRCKKEAVKKLKECGVPKSTAYDLWQRFEQPGTLDRKARSGRKASKLTGRRRRSLVKAAVDRVGVLTRKLGQRFGINQSYAVKVLHEEEVTCFKRVKTPKKKEGQENRARNRCWKLNRTLLRPSDNLSIVMDDEAYFSMKHDTNPYNDHFLT